MRTLLSLVLALTIFSSEVCLGKTNEIQLIRRAYLDITGYIPTTTEIEWYMVYSADGYRTAVDYLLQKKYTDGISVVLVKSLLLSKEYLEQPTRELTPAQIDKQVLYVAGMLKQGYTQGDILKAKLQLIQWATESTFSELDVIDYMCQELLNRESYTREANEYIKILNIAKEAHKTQEEQWLCVVEEILHNPDMTLK